MNENGIGAQTTLREDLRLLAASPRELWIVYLMKFLESVAFFTVYTLLVISLSADHGFSDTAAGSVTGIWLTAISLVVFYVVMNLGSVTQGPLITGFRALLGGGAELWGRHLSSSQLVFFVGFVGSCVNVALALLMRNPPVAPGQAAAASPLAIARDVLRSRVFWMFMGFVALLTFVRLIFQHAHLTWPKYTLREFGEDFPFALYWSINPAMIILLTPLVTALTRRFPPYPVIVGGAFVSALSVFAMAFSTTVGASVVFIVTLSLGEALWSPRLYEYTATIAPRGREASYMGLSELPLFLAKPLVGFLSGYLLEIYCPAIGPHDSGRMWLIIGLMTIASPVAMLLLRRHIETPASQTSIAAQA